MPRIAPGHDAAWAERLLELAHFCDWEAMEADRAPIPNSGVSSASVAPNTMLVRDDDPARRRWTSAPER